MFKAIIAIWAELVNDGTYTFDQVPQFIKKQVQQLLDENKETTPTE